MTSSQKIFIQDQNKSFNLFISYIFTISFYMLELFATKNKLIQLSKACIVTSSYTKTLLEEDKV